MIEKRYTTMWKPETTFSRFWIVRENWERKLNANDVVDLLNELHNENEQLKKENYKLHKRLGDFEQFEEHIKERTSKTFVKECVYFDSVLGVCNIDGSVNCPCENYEELVRWIDD